MFEVSENVVAGGLMSYGANLPDLFSRGATYLCKILHVPTGGTCRSNNRTIRAGRQFENGQAIDIAVPEYFLLVADEVIE